MPTPVAIAAELDNLTKESLSGVGVFDTLMRSAKLHLQEEYDAQRITGKEYTTVYLGALTAVLQTSAQFIVNVQQALVSEAQIAQINASIVNDDIRATNETAKTNVEITLVKQQTITELTNTCDSIPTGYGLNYVPAVPTPLEPLVSLEGAATWL